MRDMAYHSNVMTIIAKHPRRNIYCVLLSFHRRFLKLNLSENMGSSLIIKISVTRDTTMINIGNRLELKKGVPLAARLMKKAMALASVQIEFCQSVCSKSGDEESKQVNIIGVGVLTIKKRE